MISAEDRAHYYGDENVRARILEFLGAGRWQNRLRAFSPAAMKKSRGWKNRGVIPALDSLLDHGFEICRSLWDETSLLADFDVEYVNFDRPAEAFLDPERIFELQQPVAKTIEHTLHQYGIAPLHLLSGRGHHFIWRIRRDADEFQQLGSWDEARKVYGRGRQASSAGRSAGVGGSGARFRGARLGHGICRRPNVKPRPRL